MAEFHKNNQSITPNDFEYSGNVVTAICGKILGGAGSTIIGQTYTGDNETIELRSGNVFGLATNFKNTIPKKVTDLSDSDNYYTSAQCNEKFVDSTIYGNKVSEIDAGLEYLSANKQDAGDYYSATNPSGFIDKEVDNLTNYYLKTETSGKEEISAAIKDFITKGVNDLTNYYLKTETSGKEEISAAIKDFLEKPTGLADDQYYAMTKSGWAILQGAGDVSGISTVNHDDTLTGNGNQEQLGVNFDYVQTKLDAAQLQNISDVTTIKTASATWDNVSAKTNTTDFSAYTAITAPATYQPIGNYATSGEIDDDKQYGLTSAGWAEITAADPFIIGTDLRLNEDTNELSVDTNGDPHNDTEKNRNFVEGSWTEASGYNSHAEGIATTAYGYAVHAQGMWTCFSSSKWGDAQHTDTDIYWADGAGASVEGYCNATRSVLYSGTISENTYGPIHGGILKVIGNGYVEHDQQTDPDAHNHIQHPSDALIMFKDGTIFTFNDIYLSADDMAYKFITEADVDFDDYIPYTATTLPIGTNNTATNNAAAIGGANLANILSFAMGHANTGEQTGFAVGENNYAFNKSVAIGYNCTADYNVDIAIGYQCSSHDHAATFINECTASLQSMAAGNNSIAINNSVALGYLNSAFDSSVALGQSCNSSGRSFSFGHANIATNYSFLLGRGLGYTGPSTGGYDIGACVIGGWNKTTGWSTTADSPVFIVANGNGDGASRKDAFIVYRNGAIKAGNDTSAIGSNSVAFGSITYTSGDAAFAAGAWCHAIGQGAHAEGNSCGTTGYGNHIQGTFNVFESTGTTYNQPGNTPVFIGGTLNAATAQDYSIHDGYLQIMGNGIYNSQGTGTRGDAYYLFRDGTVSAKDYLAAGYTDSNSVYHEAYVPKAIPNTGDSTMKVQRMFVCTSDNDIIAHVNAGLANGEGCIFFRVG